MRAVRSFHRDAPVDLQAIELDELGDTAEDHEDRDGEVHHATMPLISSEKQ